MQAGTAWQGQYPPPNEAYALILKVFPWPVQGLPQRFRNTWGLNQAIALIAAERRLL
jgi:hypothetical protein